MADRKPLRTANVQVIKMTGCCHNWQRAAWGDRVCAWCGERRHSSFSVLMSKWRNRG